MESQLKSTLYTSSILLALSLSACGGNNALPVYKLQRHIRPIGVSQNTVITVRRAASMRLNVTNKAQQYYTTVGKHGQPRRALAARLSAVVQQGLGIRDTRRKTVYSENLNIPLAEATAGNDNNSLGTIVLGTQSSQSTGRSTISSTTPESGFLR